MRSSAPALLPIFRSDSQARILAWLLMHPDQETPIATLTPIAGVSQSNVHREVSRLVEAGILANRRAGNTRLVSANQESPYFQALVQLLGRAYGPGLAVPEELTGVRGIDRALIVGSWARRFVGESGPPPRDVDVVVVGEPNRRELRAANARLEERLETDVQVTVVTQKEWADGSTGFVRDIQSRPLVDVTDQIGRAA